MDNFFVIIITITIIILLNFIFFSIFSILHKNTVKKEAPIIIYKDQALPLDIQFGNNNFPSILYNDLFKGNNTWIGGYKLTN